MFRTISTVPFAALNGGVGLELVTKEGAFDSVSFAAGTAATIAVFSGVKAGHCFGFALGVVGSEGRASAEVAAAACCRRIDVATCAALCLRIKHWIFTAAKSRRSEAATSLALRPRSAL